ncbi:hypothetical protein SB748_26710 [Rhizobium sp. SIMBA_035]
MQNISDWLDDRMPEIFDDSGFHEQKSDFQPHAKSLWLAAEAAGYSVAQLKEACGGDVEQFLLEQQNAMTDVEVQQQIEDASAAH